MVSLDALPPADAAALLARLAARPGLRAGDTAVGELTRLCGYLPLAIGMLASQLRHHAAWSAAELAAGLAETRDRLALMRAENLSVAAAFGLSYADLTPGHQRLFRRLGLHPGPSVDAYAAAALDHTSLDEARRGLNELYDQHLVAEPAPGRYQLHDLLREHARALAAADDRAETDEAAGQLLDYYLHTALAADRRLASWASAARRAPPGHPPAQPPSCPPSGRQQPGWRPSGRTCTPPPTMPLRAGGPSTQSPSPPRYAASWPSAVTGISPPPSTRPPWPRRARPATGSARPTRSPGWASCKETTGDYPAAAASLGRAVALYGDAGDLPGQAHALNELAYLHVQTADYPAPPPAPSTRWR